MPQTSLKTDLVHAKIYEVDAKGEPVGNGISVECMFNPAEYTVSKQNQYKEGKKQKGTAPPTEFSSVGSQSLKLSLMFDTYEKGTDVSKLTRKLWLFMKPKENSENKKKPKGEPIQVAFEWGVFRFVAYITNMTQQFTMFTYQGVPVRAKVDVDFMQYTDFEDYQKLKQNPSSGGGPAEQIWKVIAGDRLDNIAAKVYHDATQWRRIAEHNQLRNPLSLRPGQILRLPLD
jgi:Contractile injection system tube protein/LysM domain